MNLEDFILFKIKDLETRQKTLEEDKNKKDGLDFPFYTKELYDKYSFGYQKAIDELYMILTGYANLTHPYQKLREEKCLKHEYKLTGSKENPKQRQCIHCEQIINEKREKGQTK